MLTVRPDKLHGPPPRPVSGRTVLYAPPRKTFKACVLIEPGIAAVPRADVPENGAAFHAQDFAAAFASQREELGYWITEIEGQVPSSIQGTLFRNGPGNFDRGQQRYAHLIDGDGHVVSFSFNPEGQVYFQSKFVRTRELLQEQKADRVLFRSTFGTQRKGLWPLLWQPSGLLQQRLNAGIQHLRDAAANAFDLTLKNPANTNTLFWGNRLLALWEAGPPYELDPHTLDTRPGPETLDGFVLAGIAPSTTGIPALDRFIGLGSAMTAHPHCYPAEEDSAARLVAWTWRCAGLGLSLDINIAEFDSDWQRLGGARFRMPDFSLHPHDFALTTSHYVFFQNTARRHVLPYVLGFTGPAQCIEIQTEAPMQICLVPRNGGSTMAKTFPAEACFLIHHANAFEDGQDVVVWSSGWGPAALQGLKSGAGLLGSWRTILQGDFSSTPHSSMLEHRINGTTGKVTRKVLYDEQSGDYPCVNPLFYSRRTRYLFCVTGNSPARSPSPPQALRRIDTFTGEVQSWAPGSRCFTEELVFVPGPNAAQDETDGHLLGIVFDAARNRSSLVVMDAKAFAQGPVCRLWLNHRIPHGLHGCFTTQYCGPSVCLEEGKACGSRA